MPRKHYVPKCKSTYPGNEEKVSVFTSPTNIDESEKWIWISPNTIYAMHCAIWYQSLFGVCMVVGTHANTC